MNLTVCPLRGPGSIPSHGGVFQGMAGHTLPSCPEPMWQEMTQPPLNATTQPVDMEDEGL